MNKKNLKLNGKELILTKALPLTLGDWRRLEESGLSTSNLESGGIKDIITIVHYIAHKANKEITVSDVEDQEMDSPVVQAILDGIRTKDEPIDRPS